MRFSLTLLTAAIAPMAAITLGACSSESKSDSMTMTSQRGSDGADGAMEVDSISITATVKSIDAARRQVTLIQPNGVTATYTAGRDAVNFDQIKVGDRVNAVVIEEFAVYLRKAGTPASTGEGGMIALAPKGKKPGVLMASTVEVTAKVTAVDESNHMVTMEFANGSTKRIKVGKDVNLSNVKPGDSVTAVMTESLAMLVETP